MAANPNGKQNGRHAILDLAPLELDCLSVLWPIGEGTVRDIREGLRESRPRAYTTIMTIMDRMAQKGIVSRRKLGRAWMYSPNISATEARERAVHRLVEHFFAGSAAALMEQLAGKQPAVFTTRGLIQDGGLKAAPTPRAARQPRRVREEQASEARPTPKMDDALL